MTRVSMPRQLFFKKAETEDVEKWLWSLSVIKKIVTEDISAPLDEYDIGGLAMVMEAPEDWEKMRRFLESLYDLGHVDMTGTTKEVLNRIAELNDATLAAIKECSDVQIEMDPNTRISFDHYAVAATEVIAKILLEKDPAVSIDYYLRIDRENLRAAVESIKDLCGEPEKITGEGEPEKIIDVPVESAGGSGGEAVSPPEKQYEEEEPAYEYKPKRKVGRWFGAVLGGLAVAGLCIYGGMKLNQHMAEKKETIGYQAYQSLIGLGNGGLFGVGIGQGKQKFFYLPEPHTDFVISILGEEIGFVGLLVIGALFVFIVYRGMMIALNASDRMGQMMAFGFTLTIALYTLLHAFVGTGLVPTTGVPLPFLSYGGMSLVFMMSSIGIVLNISSKTRPLVDVRKSFKSERIFKVRNSQGT